MENFKIIKLQKEYVEDVFRIEKIFFDVKSSEHVYNSLNSETLDYFLLFVDEVFVGFLECSLVLDEAELYEIAIAKEYQGKSYSKLLMKFFLAYCESKNIRTIFLEVNRINTKAISLYHRFGFIEYAVRENYYGDNDAILMKLDR